MALEETLLALEEGFWGAAGDAAFYREHLAEEGLMVFPGVGFLDHHQTVEAVDAAEPWAHVRFDETRVAALTADSAVVTYRATAHREGQDEYVALASSVYVRRGGEWRLALHQQTPLGDSE